jgi:hypothetical protein
VYINRCLRKILNIKWPNTITNGELWNTTREISTVEQTVKKKRKYKWIGHTFKKLQESTDRTAMDWNCLR